MSAECCAIGRACISVVATDVRGSCWMCSVGGDVKGLCGRQRFCGAAVPQKLGASVFRGAQLLLLQQRRRFAREKQPQREEMGTACSAQQSDARNGATDGTASERVNYASVSDGDWKRRLTKEQFNIARKKGTERAFTGEYWNTKTAGTYLCVCCNTPLFSSSTKYDSGTGWPSFYQYVGDNVKSHMDWSIPFMPRNEVVCAVCDAHLGHVFDDGPNPSGKRYCINRCGHILIDESEPVIYEVRGEWQQRVFARGDELILCGRETSASLVLKPEKQAERK